MFFFFFWSRHFNRVFNSATRCSEVPATHSCVTVRSHGSHWNRCDPKAPFQASWCCAGHCLCLGGEVWRVKNWAEFRASNFVFLFWKIHAVQSSESWTLRCFFVHFFFFLIPYLPFHLFTCYMNLRSSFWCRCCVFWSFTQFSIKTSFMWIFCKECWNLTFIFRFKIFTWISQNKAYRSWVKWQGSLLSWELTARLWVFWMVL